jgi:hypothetical protein
VSRRRAAIEIGVLLLLSIVGCRTGPPPLVPTLGTPLAVDDPRAERALERHLSLVAARPALRGLARVALEGPDFKLNRPQRIAIERPDRLRFEVLGLFDQLAGLLVVDGRDYGFFDASNGEIVRGEVRPTLLWELTRIDLEASEVVALLLGAPTPSSGAARAGVWLQPDGRLAIAFAWPDPEARRPAACQLEAGPALFEPECFLAASAIEAGGEIFFFDESDRLRELRVLEPEGRIRFRAIFEDYALLTPSEVEDEVLAEDGEFAKTVMIQSPAIESAARFVWKRVMLARGLSDRFFQIPEPDGRGQGG